MKQALTTRQGQILTTVVEAYITSGEPVSSAAIARMLAETGAVVSSATVRNEMADMTEAGLLEQPHTSAGRIPSAAAFRLYVQGLAVQGKSEKPAAPSLLQTTIDAGLAGVRGTDALLARSSGLLAAVSSGVGLAVGALAASDLLAHVHFTRLGKERVLAVVVGRSGTVHDRLLALQNDLSSSQLEAAGNFLNEHFRGWQLERVRAEILRRIERERSDYQRMMEAAEQLWSSAVPQDSEGFAGERAVFVEGMANLVGLREDRTHLRELLLALEAKQRVAALLAAYIDARQESVRVIFGIEEHAPELAGLVLIAAPARLPGSLLGSIGVLGPKRMDYNAAIGAVGYVSQQFDRVLEGGERGKP